MFRAGILTIAVSVAYFTLLVRVSDIQRDVASLMRQSTSISSATSNSSIVAELATNASSPVVTEAVESSLIGSLMSSIFPLIILSLACLVAYYTVYEVQVSISYLFTHLSSSDHHDSVIPFFAVNISSSVIALFVC